MRTTLTAAQVAVVVSRRTTLLLPTDDLLAITREFINPAVSRAGLGRCLRRHSVSQLTDLVTQESDGPATKKTFKNYKPGFIHIDIKYPPQMPDETVRRYLFMVERFNGRIREIVGQTRFASAAELESTLLSYLNIHNNSIPQRALNHMTPIQALKDWQAKKPELFVKRVYNQAGLDT